MSDKRIPPKYEDGGRASIVIALASLSMAVMELKMAVKLTDEADKFVSEQLEDVLKALDTITGDVAEDKGPKE